MTVTIWHNPRCSKSRETLALLRARGIEPVIRLYLIDQPDEKEVAEALARLDLPAIEMIRQDEKQFREFGLSRKTDQVALIAAMARCPILIERPVVFIEDQAVIGRPASNVLDLL